jgi:tape measure domain-containing protein
MADSIITTLRLIGHRSYISGMDSAARSVNRLERANDDASGGLSIFQSRLGGVRGMLGLVSSALKGTTLAAGALTLYVAKTGIEFNANMERAEIGMGTLLKSTQKARDVSKEVTKFALKSPLLGVAESMQTVQQLLGSGMGPKQSVNTLKAFSDTLSAMGRSPDEIKRLTYAFAQMFSKGRIGAEELRGQLGEIFPAAKILAREMFAKQTKDPAKQMQLLTDAMKAGEVPASNLRLLVRGMQKDFKGGTERSAKTFTGMMKNIQENFKYTSGLLTEGLFKVLEKDVLPAVQKIQEGIQGWAKGGGMKRLVSATKTGFKTGDKDSVAGYKGIEGVFGKIGAIAGTVFPQVVKYAKEFWEALKPLGPFVTNVLAPLALGFGKGLLAGIIGLIPLIKVVAQVLGWIGEKAKPIRGILEGIGFVIGFVFGPAKLGIFRIFGRALSAVWGVLGRVRGAAGAVGEVVAWVSLRFEALAAKVASVAARVASRFLGIPGKLVSVGGKIVSTIIKGLSKLGGGIANVIAGAVTVVAEAAMNLGRSIWDGIKSGIMSVIPDKVKNVVSDALGLSGAAPKTHGGAMATPGGRPRRRAHGGLASGATLVGESGPELLHVPGPGMISPLSGLSTPDLSGAVHFNVTAPIFLNQRQIAQAVFDESSDRNARR